MLWAELDGRRLRSKLRGRDLNLLTDGKMDGLKVVAVPICAGWIRGIVSDPKKGHVSMARRPSQLIFLTLGLCLVGVSILFGTTWASCLRHKSANEVNEYTPDSHAIGSFNPLLSLVAHDKIIRIEVTPVRDKSGSVLKKLDKRIITDGNPLREFQGILKNTEGSWEKLPSGAVLSLAINSNVECIWKGGDRTMVAFSTGMLLYDRFTCTLTPPQENALVAIVNR